MRVLLSALIVCSSANAADFSLTGFGTVGYAVSDQNFRYLRYIDNGGTLKVDSLIGLQGEITFDPQWSATVQAVASAPRTRDVGYEAQFRWAFVSYRPNNEWLFRVGRLRPPVLINTQNAEVGVTYDQARLPAEVYSLSPVYDVDGAAFTRTWNLNSSEVNLDGYYGKTKIKQRFPYQRDSSQSVLGDPYFAEKVTIVGLVLSRSAAPLFLRAGFHRATVRSDELRLFLDTFNPIPFPAPTPFGGTLYVPGNVVDKVRVSAFTVGAELLAGSWKVSGEYGKRLVEGTVGGTDGTGGSVTVARATGSWTPYITYARLLSGSGTRKYYQDLDATPVPLGAQGPPLLLSPKYHNNVADTVFVFDQYSIMLGTSYTFSATSKLKFELMRTHVGLASALVDGDVHRKSFNVFSMSYNFVF